MKLFFASDLHGCAVSTQLMLDAFEKSGAEHLILLGDLLNHGPRNALPEGYDPIKVSELLNQYAEQIIAVRGNCDSEVDQMLLNFPIMADYNWILLPSGQRLFLTHGHLYNADKLPTLRKGDIVASGHTHLPVAEQQGDYVFFNPGSVTIPRGGNKPSVGLLEDGMLKVVTLEQEAMLDITLEMTQ